MRCATAGDNERPFRQSQVDAAVRFCAKVFGQEYAALLTKAADVASHGERKAAAGLTRRAGLPRPTCRLRRHSATVM